MAITLLITAFGAILVLIAALTLFGTVGRWLSRRRERTGLVIPSPDVDFESDRNPPGA
jgi:hypothetical protein